MKMRDIMRSAKVIPVLVIEELQSAVELGCALVEGGCSVLEITLRSSVALEAIRLMASEIEGAVVGVGSVRTPEQLEQAAKAGAEFAVSPGLTPSLTKAAHSLQLPFLPGVMTPTEILNAADAGFYEQKLFPASLAGGLEFLKAIAGPISEISFCPTGGINEQNCAAYLAMPNVLCVGGSWLAPKDVVAAHDWKSVVEITRRSFASLA